MGTFYFRLALIYLKWIPSWLKLNQYKPGQNQFRSVQTSVHIGLTKSIYKAIQITLVWLLCEDKLGLANFLKLDILQNQPKLKKCIEFLLDLRLFTLTNSSSSKRLWHLRKKNQKCLLPVWSLEICLHHLFMHIWAWWKAKRTRKRPRKYDVFWILIPEFTVSSVRLKSKIFPLNSIFYLSVLLQIWHFWGALGEICSTCLWKY